jgi:hypothetical protein
MLVEHYHALKIANSIKLIVCQALALFAVMELYSSQTVSDLLSNVMDIS